jgi:Protein of unknown function (DUF3102)
MKRSEYSEGEAVIDRLEALAEKANACHADACRVANEYVRFATEAGTALFTAKKTIGHGHWLAWVKANLTFSERTARYYMQLAGLPEEDRQRVAEMSLREAVKALAHHGDRDICVDRHPVLSDPQYAANLPTDRDIRYELAALGADEALSLIAAGTINRDMTLDDACALRSCKPRAMLNPHMSEILRLVIGHVGINPVRDFVRAYNGEQAALPIDHEILKHAIQCLSKWAKQQAAGAK